MSKQSQLRIAIIGCDSHGAQCAALLEDARLVVTCDRNPRRAAALAENVHACFATNDVSEALSFMPDAVIITTPIKTMVEIAVAALRAGSHLFLNPKQAPKDGDLETVQMLAGASRRLVAVRTSDLAESMASFLRRLRDLLAR